MNSDNYVIGTRVGFSTAKSRVDVQSSIGSIKGDGGSSAQFNLAPAIGYFLTNNFVGQVVSSQDISNIEHKDQWNIDTGQLHQGIYFVRLQTNTGVMHRIWERL